jgi:hypothetical protein
MLRRMFALFILLFALCALPVSAQTPCPSKLFVSGYGSTVHIYDACTGAFLRVLDTRSRINGAQAVKIGPDDNIYVVSENLSKILKYNRDTFDFMGEFASVNGGPTGLDFDRQGRMYVARYGASSVRRYDTNGVFIDEPVPAGPRLVGPDNGMLFGPDDKLYIPGYDSSNVMRFDPATNELVEVVPAGAQGLSAARGLRVAKDNQHLWLTAELSGQLFKFNIATRALTLVTSGLTRPTGIDYAPDGSLLVNSSGAVVKIDPATGARLGTFVAAGTGGLALPTYITVIGPKVVAAPVEVVEYFVIALNKYFITGRTAEKTLLDGLPASFRRTGAQFAAFSATGAPSGTESICRFYLPTSKGGPNTHFYGRPADCDLVRGTGNPVFEYEGEDFAVTIPVSGACPVTAPFTVYRSFNNRATQNDGNHRYTNVLTRYNEMTAKGWTGEGPVFCTSSAVDGTE